MSSDNIRCNESGNKGSLLETDENQNRVSILTFDEGVADNVSDVEGSV